MLRWRCNSSKSNLLSFFRENSTNPWFGYFEKEKQPKLTHFQLWSKSNSLFQVNNSRSGKEAISTTINPGWAQKWSSPTNSHRLLSSATRSSLITIHLLQPVFFLRPTSQPRILTEWNVNDKTFYQRVHSHHVIGRGGIWKKISEGASHLFLLQFQVLRIST